MAKLPITPSFRIRSKLAMLFTQSRERAAALKRTGYCCNRCGVKQSSRKGHVVKIVGHHINPTNYKKLVDGIREQLLVSPDLIEPLCVECHKQHHADERGKDEC